MLAYGTETIRPVAKITGPGNAFVAAAKKLVSGDVGIDMIAGPSEVCVVADETADPRLVAIDLMAQAEHDPLAACYLVTFSDAYADAVEAAIQVHLASPNHTLPTGGTARYSSPLSVDDFVKKSSIIQYSPAALKNDARAVVQIATHEGLWAHARSVALRLKALLDAEQASVAGSAAAGVEDGEARGE